MSDIVNATYTGTMLPPRNDKEAFTLQKPVTKTVGNEKTVNKSDKSITKEMLATATVKVNANGTVSVTIPEGKPGRKTKSPVQNPTEYLASLGVEIK